MAQYHFAAKIVSRSRGQSAVASAAYRAGELMNDERLGRTFDFRRHLGVVYTDILAPANAPDWMRDRAQLWNAVEKAEKRKDSQLARSLDIALPYELSLDFNIELLRGFVQEQWVDKGMIADIAIHLPGRTGDIRNVHAHVALTTREITGSGFGRKERDWNSKKELVDWRKAWANHANRILEREGFEERIDHRSLVDQGIDREPTTHVGPAAKEMEQHGMTSERAQRNRDITTANDNLADLQNELAESEKRIAELKKQLVAERMEQIQKTVRAVNAAYENAEQPQAPAKERPQEPDLPARQPEIRADIPEYAAPDRPRPSAAERIQQAQKIIRAVDAAYEKTEQRWPPKPEPPPEPGPPAPDHPPEPKPPEPEPPAPASPPPTPPVPSGPAPRERPPAKYADLDQRTSDERAKEQEAERQRQEEQDREREHKRRRRRGR
jgi:archaellum component FlaC